MSPANVRVVTRDVEVVDGGPRPGIDFADHRTVTGPRHRPRPGHATGFKARASVHPTMEDTGIYARESEVLGRAVQLGVASGRVISVSFPEAVPADAETEHPLLDRMVAYLAGEADDFHDVEVALTVPTDQRRVLEAVRTLPHGETISVERLARLAGLDDDDADDLETVRSALGENPTPILVPDHRVRDASGATLPAVAERLRSLES